MSFSKALAYSLLFAIALVGLSLVATFFLQALGVPAAVGRPASGFVAAVGALALAAALEMHLSKATFRGALSLLGFKAIGPQQLLPVLDGLAPLAIAYVVIFFVLAKPATLEPGIGFLILKFFFSQGLVEEAVFRGFIYRHLRVGRSYLRAAALSGLLFGVIHLANFTNGFSVPLLIGVSVSVVYGFILTFPLAGLFEISAGSILAASLWHLAIDSINWFHDASEGSAMNVYLVAVLVSAALVQYAVTRRRSAGK